MPEGQETLPKRQPTASAKLKDGSNVAVAINSHQSIRDDTLQKEKQKQDGVSYYFQIFPTHSILSI